MDRFIFPIFVSCLALFSIISSTALVEHFLFFACAGDFEKGQREKAKIPAKTTWGRFFSCALGTS